MYKIDDLRDHDFNPSLTFKPSAANIQANSFVYLPEGSRSSMVNIFVRHSPYTFGYPFESITKLEELFKKWLSMNVTLLFNVPAAVIAIAIFLLILLFNWLGFRYRQRQARKYPNDEIDNIGAVEGSLLGLLGLLLAFSFGIASSKFEGRRAIIIEEANHIGTALLRCDLYPDSVRSILRKDFREYIEARIDYYNAGDDEHLIKRSLEKGSVYSLKLWKLVTQEGQNPQNLVRTAQMVPALNAMIDIVSTRNSNRLAKVPPLILIVLLTLTLTSGFLSGYSNKAKHRNMVFVIAFALMTTLALYLVMELDRPRRGIINLDAAQKNITDLRNEFVEDK